MSCVDVCVVSACRKQIAEWGAIVYSKHACSVCVKNLR